MESDEAERCGLVSRVVPAKKLRDEAITAATKIAEKSMVAVAMVKEMEENGEIVILASGEEMV